MGLFMSRENELKNICKIDSSFFYISKSGNLCEALYIMPWRSIPDRVYIYPFHSKHPIFGHIINNEIFEDKD